MVYKSHMHKCVMYTCGYIVWDILLPVSYVFFRDMSLDHTWLQSQSNLGLVKHQETASWRQGRLCKQSTSQQAPTLW